MVRDIGIQSNQYWKKFAREGARDFDDEAWLQMIFGGSTKKRIEYFKNDVDGILCFFYQLFRDTLVVFQSSQN